MGILSKARDAVDDAKQTVSVAAAVSVAALIMSVFALIVAIVRA